MSGPSGDGRPATAQRGPSWPRSCRSRRRSRVACRRRPGTRSCGRAARTRCPGAARAGPGAGGRRRRRPTPARGRGRRTASGTGGAPGEPDEVAGPTVSMTKVPPRRPVRLDGDPTEVDQEQRVGRLALGREQLAGFERGQPCAPGDERRRPRGQPRKERVGAEDPLHRPAHGAARRGGRQPRRTGWRPPPRSGRSPRGTTRCSGRTRRSRTRRTGPTRSRACG